MEMIAHKEHSRYALAAKSEKSHRSRSPSEKARVVPLGCERDDPSSAESREPSGADDLRR
ncbi:UNVERIFIED_ORG: hypothetical protein QOE_1661, partial [Clostridioides difficile F501]